MMKAVCIVGSPRTGGSSDILTDAFLAGFQEGSGEAEKILIGTRDIRYCRGCKCCYADGCCPQKDDVAGIIASLLAADAVLIAAPSYWASVPGQLKTLFDRTTPYGDTNPRRLLRAEKPIKGYAIAVRAGTHPEENELLLREITHYFGHLGIETAGRLSVCGVDTPDDLLTRHPQAMQEARLLGRTAAGG